jgi:hypothetical protein
MLANTFARIALAAVLALGVVPSTSAIEVLGKIEEALEIHLNFVEMPLNESDAVRINGCASCATVTKAVTPATRYFISRTELPFVDFRAAVDDLKASHRGAETTLVGVFYNVETDLVTRIILIPAKN